MPSDSGAEVEDEASLPHAFAPVAALDAPPLTDEDGPPPEAIENAMRAELAARENSGRSTDAVRRGAARPTGDEDEGRDQTPLPELDELVARIPADVRETLGELFRARFVSVKKLPKRFFQAASSRAGGETKP